MIDPARTMLRIAFVAAVMVAGLLADEKAVLLQSNALTTNAEARVGRPLTPVSYAGVARRTTRRAVAVGVAVGAAAATCVQAVDAYGRVYTRC